MDGLATGGAIVTDIYRMGSLCNRLNSTFVRQGGNTIASSLAKFTRSIDNVFVWLEYPLEWLNESLSFDST